MLYCSLIFVSAAAAFDLFLAVSEFGILPIAMGMCLVATVGISAVAPGFRQPWRRAATFSSFFIGIVFFRAPITRFIRTCVVTALAAGAVSLWNKHVGRIGDLWSLLLRSRGVFRRRTPTLHLPCGGLCLLPTDAESDDEESAETKRQRVAQIVQIGCGHPEHRMCRACIAENCLRMAIREKVVASCPMCHEALSSDVAGRFLTQQELRQYKEIELAVALARFSSCPTPNCSFRFDVPGEFRSTPIRMDCPMCSKSCCSSCLSQPFHQGVSCESFPAARAEFYSVLRALCVKRKLSASASAELGRYFGNYEILRQDEERKAHDCKLCPNCNRVVERISGCSLMRCGQDFHGGNSQNGCGHRFDWSAALPYRQQTVEPPSAPSALLKSKARHDALDACENCLCRIIGLRFQCMECPSRPNFCENCFCAVFGALHPVHLFEVHHLPPAILSVFTTERDASPVCLTCSVRFGLFKFRYHCEVCRFPFCYYCLKPHKASGRSLVCNGCLAKL
jgi:hypothetical protein